MDVKKTPTKKEYSAPLLMVHGDVEKITQNTGGTVISDVPVGDPINGFASAL